MNWKAVENRLYVRLLIARKQPELAAALSYASSVVCPRCGGTLVNVKLQVPDKNPGRPAGGRDFSRRGERQGTPFLRGRGVSCGLPQRQASNDNPKERRQPCGQ